LTLLILLKEIDLQSNGEQVSYHTFDRKDGDVQVNTYTKYSMIKNNAQTSACLRLYDLELELEWEQL
jgi:hypothetical protein